VGVGVGVTFECRVAVSVGAAVALVVGVVVEGTAVSAGNVINLVVVGVGTIATAVGVTNTTSRLHPMSNITNSNPTHFRMMASPSGFIIAGLDSAENHLHLRRLN
jgi:hypothetical protein